jgi:hypothetical protein
MLGHESSNVPIASISKDGIVPFCLILQNQQSTELMCSVLVVLIVSGPLCCSSTQ